ncbi:MAG TPA: sulfatase-like hydrolase/transferase [Thermoanaerobaculia bacterium]|jgi:arylsulfatase A-like enzyme/Tfp pilus assembly protein PilF|nr:sulfatase-like hydrolase/transferase [Thermoanaerobaculia bacterium]
MRTFLASLLTSYLALTVDAAERVDASKPNLLLITLDTTRADHLGCYGMKSAKTPVLDTLAARGALFEQAHSHVPLTLPSHAVLLTGKLPSTLNLRVNGSRLKPNVATLATILKSRGYWTGAVVATSVLNRAYGLASGFTVYDDHMTLSPPSGGPAEERRASEVTSRALEVVGKIKAPIFLWVHYYDPHYHYRPPPPYAAKYAKHPYDGEIAYMDASIGNLLVGLRATGLLDNALIVVAGDHGEGLNEHGERQHGVFLYEYALRVPLLMIWEGRIRAALRIGTLCGLADVAPTILDLMQQTPVKTDGLSLRPLLEGGRIIPRTLYAESYHGSFTYGWAPLRAIMTSRWKFIEAPRPELYEWRDSEEKNLYDSDRREVRIGRKALRRHPSADPAEKAAAANDRNSEETRKRLISLGYLAPGGVRADDSARLDPKDGIAIEREIWQAAERLENGDVRSGIRTLLSVVKRNPRNIYALSMLGLTYLKTGDYEKAKACFQEAIRLHPELESARANLGTTYRKMGNMDAAAEEYRAALVISARHAEAASNLARIYSDKHLFEDARRVLQSAIDAGGESADVWFELGVLEANGSNWEKARFAFTKAASIDPARGDAYVSLGKIAYAQGDIDESIYQYQRAVRIAPKNTGYLATLGSLYLNGKNDPVQALHYYRQALAADPYAREAAALRDLIAGLEARGIR